MILTLALVTAIYADGDTIQTYQVDVERGLVIAQGSFSTCHVPVTVASENPYVLVGLPSSKERDGLPPCDKAGWFPSKELTFQLDMDAGTFDVFWLGKKQHTGKVVE